MIRTILKNAQMCGSVRGYITRIEFELIVMIQKGKNGNIEDLLLYGSPVEINWGTVIDDQLAKEDLPPFARMQLMIMNARHVHPIQSINTLGGPL